MNWHNEEQRIISLFTPQTKIIYKNHPYIVDFCDKPHYGAGEGKTDIYIRCTDGTEIKITSKAINADFVENKISAARYEAIYGKDYSPLLTAINNLKEKFQARQVYYPQKTGRIEAGSYTMGWRVDIMNKLSGELSTLLPLTLQQKEQILYGTALTGNKRNPSINNNIIPDAGIANCILLDSEKYHTAQEVIDALIEARDYEYNLYVAFKAVNYRSLSNKIDGNRPLGIAIKWYAPTQYELIFNKPLQFGAKNDMLKFFKEHIK